LAEADATRILNSHLLDGPTMSNTQFAFLKKSAVPAREALQQAIDALGFDLKLHLELDFFNAQGFLPCTLNGEPGIGFELSSGPASDFIDDDEEFQEIAGDNDWCISMTWRSSMEDCASALVVSCALANDFAAVISYEGEEPAEVNDMIAETRTVIQELQEES
jgi:hypothetical protein